MREREFQGWVVDTATRLGWRVWHVPTPMRPIGGSKFVPDPRGRGLPDLTMVHRKRPRLYFAELKTHDGELSVDQAEFLGLLGVVEAAVRDMQSFPHAVESPVVRGFVWRPGNEPTIEALLRA